MNNSTILKRPATDEQAQALTLLRALLETQRKLVEANREHQELLLRVTLLERLLYEGEAA